MAFGVEVLKCLPKERPPQPPAATANAVSWTRGLETLVPPSQPAEAAPEKGTAAPLTQARAGVPAEAADPA